jgi:hypothetical protein
MRRRRRVRRPENGLTVAETIIVQVGVAALIFGVAALVARMGWFDDVVALVLGSGPTSAGELMEMVRAFWQ